MSVSAFNAHNSMSAAKMLGEPVDNFLVEPEAFLPPIAPQRKPSRVDFEAEDSQESQGEDANDALEEIYQQQIRAAKSASLAESQAQFRNSRS